MTWLYLPHYGTRVVVGQSAVLMKANKAGGAVILRALEA